MSQSCLIDFNICLLQYFLGRRYCRLCYGYAPERTTSWQCCTNDAITAFLCELHVIKDLEILSFVQYW